MRTVPVSIQRSLCSIDLLERRSLLSAVGIFSGAGDVGAPHIAGSDAYSSGAYTLQGNSTDIWGLSDQFNFAYSKWTGDGVLVARVKSVQNTDPWAKAGVMFRQTLDANSADAYVSFTPQNEVEFADRPIAGATASDLGDVTGTPAAPMWLKEVRLGNNFTTFLSSDGSNWSQIGGPVTVPMSATVYVGLVVSSHNTSALNTSVFDSVSLTKPISTGPATGVYQLSTRGQPGMSLTVAGSANADGATVDLYHTSGTANQQWLVENEGDGTYRIYAYRGINSMQMLNLAGTKAGNGMPVNTFSDNGANAQRWVFKTVAGGYWEIMPLTGVGAKQTLEIAGGNGAGSGAKTDVWSYWSGNNQVFKLSTPAAAQFLTSSKKGLAGSPNEAVNIRPSWVYTWDSNLPSGLPAGTDYAPMTWGYYGNTNGSFTNTLNKIKAIPGVKEILGFNEPDGADQANMTVASALEGWGLLQSTGLKLISPAAVDDSDAWMQSFMAGAAQKGYRVDAVAIHWYGGADAASFIGYVNKIHTLYNKPIWITEFSPADWSYNYGVTSQQATAFMRTVIPQLKAMSFVERYSWFSGNQTSAALGQGALYNSDGSLTPLGRLYSRM